MSMITPIPERTLSENLRQLVSHEPFIVRGGAKAWPAFTSWSVEEFERRFGDREYDAAVELPTGVPTLYGSKDFVRRMTMKDFGALMKSATYERPCYLHQRPLHQFPGLEPDVGFSSFTDQRVAVNLWIGSAGTKSSLHFDFQDGLLAQVRGSKRFWLVAPQHSNKLAAIPGVIQKSTIDPEAADFASYQSRHQLPALSGDLGPGDIIHIPAGWWHAVRGLTESISVNAFFGPYMGALRRMGYIHGPTAWGVVARDFVKHGLLGVQLPGRLFSSEPFGVWLYAEITGKLSRLTRMRASAR
jgi:hypothetical protein